MGGADGAQPIKEEQALCFQRAWSAGQSQFMIKKKKRERECGDRWGLVLMRDVDEGKRSVCSGVWVEGGGRDGGGGELSQVKKDPKQNVF